MAYDTPRSFRNLVFYSVYVRDHGPCGHFAEVEADLPRIKKMGVDVVWFMPIHPIGQLKKKGKLGCPYSISDYRGVNPEYGTRADFARLIKKAHGLSLKVMIDVVYNHTAHDSALSREHPGWYHQNEAGNPVSTVPDWTDVIDLKHPQPQLAAYLIKTLQGWARLGVDGFRCDVASLLPEEFWRRARRDVARTKPGVIWLAESINPAWIAARRAQGLRAVSDSELFRAFDLLYDYDIWSAWQAAVQGLISVAKYLELLRWQDGIYPANYVKMRYVENHDQLRIMAMAPSRNQALAWTAFQAFNQGAFLIYAGQESAARHRPSLFDREPIQWGQYGLQSFLTRLACLKKDPAMVAGQFVVTGAKPAVQASWIFPGANLHGVFNVKGAAGDTRVALPNGTYVNLLDERRIVVKGGRMALPKVAAIVRCESALPDKPLYAHELDYQYHE
jgi:glycosidase